MHAGVAANAVISEWVVLNIVMVVSILVLIKLGPPTAAAPPSGATHVAAALGAIGMLARTVVDYWISWDFYFPIQPPP
jgi:hypothetical protein